ncbi:MAG TPA: dihydroneopterin aldolase [Magnetovibrio sp.]
MNTPTVRLIHPPSIADARSSIRHVFVRDLMQMCAIGVHDHERNGPQRVRLNLDLAVYEGEAGAIADNIQNVVCYEQITTAVRAVCSREHINLVETLAEDIAQVCLAHDQVRSVRVRVEKLDVFEDVSSVGVEIERFNPEV